MRAWLTPRTMLTVLLLVVAPGAALAHLLVTWLPERLAVVHLNREVTQHQQALDAEWQQGTRLQAELTRTQEALQAAHSQPCWLPRRDKDLVFDHVAAAFRAADVALEQLTLEDPGLYAAASRKDLLACERIAVRCTGSYAGLTGCLDSVAALDLPARVTQLAWGRGEGALALGVQLEVPFVPDATLTKLLADAAGLEEDSDGP